MGDAGKNGEYPSKCKALDETVAPDKAHDEFLPWSDRL
jgi:hypothetical protein